jgi:hypothetical protein
MLILIILIVLLFGAGGGGGLYLGNPYLQHGGIGLGTILVIILIVWLVMGNRL